jgi:hypothetical protein
MSDCFSTGGHRFTVVTSYQYLPGLLYSPGRMPSAVSGVGTYFPTTSVRCMYCGATKRDG